MAQNLWDTAKAVLRAKFIMIKTSMKQEKSQIKNFTIPLKALGKKSPNLSRRKGIIKIITEIETKKTEMINETNSSDLQR